MPTASPAPIPVPASLADVLALAGLRGSVVVERLDGKPLTTEQEQLARGLVTKHGQPMSDADVAAKAKAYMQRQGSTAPTVKAPRSSGKAPAARSKAPGKVTASKPRKASKATPRKAARRPTKG